MRTGDYNDGAQLQDTSHHISSKHIRLEGVCGFGFLGIELDIFIIEVNLTRDSSKIQNVILETPTSSGSMGLDAACLKAYEIIGACSVAGCGSRLGDLGSLEGFR